MVFGLRASMCTAVMYVPCVPSSRPGAKIRKKLGWKLSHFTLRTLETAAVCVSPATSNVSVSPSLSLSSSKYSVDTETSGLPASSAENHLPAVISLSRLSSPLQVMFWSRFAKPRPRCVSNWMSSTALPLMCVMRARTIGRTRTSSAPRSSRNVANSRLSSDGMLMKKKLGVSAGRLRRQSPSRSLRTTVSTSSIMMPSANADSCTMLSVRRRPRLAMP